MKKLFLVVVLSSLLLASGCRTDNYVGRIISPVGSPTFALIDFDEILDTNSTPTNINAHFAGNQYDVIVFDAITGLKNIKTNNRDFKLFRPITVGNYHLVSVNSGLTNEPDSDSIVVNFVQNSTGDQVFKNLYPSVSDIRYVGSVAEAAAVAKSGKLNGNDVDYVVLAQPSLVDVFSGTETTAFPPKYVKHLGQKWAETFSGQQIPQAGLFIRYNNAYLKHQTYFDEFLTKYDLGAENAASEPLDVLNQIDHLKDWGEDPLAAQRLRFGYDTQVIRAALELGTNPFGIVLPQENDDVDINAFLTNLGESADYSDLIKY